LLRKPGIEHPYSAKNRYGPKSMRLDQSGAPPGSAFTRIRGVWTLARVGLSGPNASQAAEMVSRRWSPIQRLLTPGSPSPLRPRNPPSPATMRVTSRIDGVISGTLSGSGVKAIIAASHNILHRGRCNSNALESASAKHSLHAAARSSFILSSRAALGAARFGWTANSRYFLCSFPKDL
jgi:hypothetical protein